jgi:hypothetical protein
MAGRGYLLERPMTASPTPKRKRPVTIGWREWVVFPELWDGPIKAKIDTGARTSAIHAYHIRPVLRGGERFVRFDIHPVQHHKQPEISCIAPIHDRRVVTSSNGLREKRYIILTRLRIGTKSWPVELSLTNRDELGFRVLIGRQAIRGHAVVDPGRSYIVPMLKNRRPR